MAKESFLPPGVSTVRGDYSTLRPDIAVLFWISFQWSSWPEAHFFCPIATHIGTNKESAATGSKSPVHVPEQLPVVDHTTSGGRCHDTYPGLEKQRW